MPAKWLLFAVPATPLLLAAILVLSGFVEQRFLSPRSLILEAARARRTTPEHAESLVARQFEQLLQEEAAGAPPVAVTRPAASSRRRRRG